MDGRRFDKFTVALGRTTSRRQWIKTWAAGLLAAGSGVTSPQAAAQDEPDTEQSTSPLPNFPFLAVMPTDSRFSAYAVDERLTGPPTRYRSLEAMRALPDEWRAALGPGFQSAYSATVAKPQADDADKPESSVTTCIFDLGSEEAVNQARAQYIASLFDNPLLTELDSDAAADSQIVLGGCQGGCERLSSPMAVSEPATSEIVVVGSRGQFLFDARVRNFTGDPVSSSMGDSVARLVDSRLQGVTALTAGSAAASAAPSGAWLRRLTPILRPHAARSRLQNATEDLRAALASRNTLPIFDLGSGEPPLKAKQTLVVDDGAIVVKFGETPAQAAARQRSAEDVVFACATEQPLPMDEPYRGGYDLNLSTLQYVFLSEEDAEEFLEETRERLQRDRPRIVLTEVLTSDDEIRDIYQDGRKSRGYSYGCQSHQVLRLGAVAAILAVELSATPRSAEEDEIDFDDLEDELCPIVEQAAEKFVLCIISPDECRSAFPLDLPGTIRPAATSTPACLAPKTMCNGQCVDTNQDCNHCGNCGTSCSQGHTCQGGRCRCAPGLTDCGNYCSDLSADPGNCGNCGAACGANQHCAGGACVCPNGEPVCGGAICCDDTWTCQGGTCVQPCQDPMVSCGGTCIDPMSDPMNCGGCDSACGSGASCCGGVCVDPGNDPANCGSCGQNCGDGANCCGGICADPMSDPMNCSGCGQNCGSGSCCGGTCADLMSDPVNCGSCGWACPGTSCCAGTCTDTSSDPYNCGACGNACDPGYSCYSGTCVTVLSRGSSQSQTASQG